MRQMASCSTEELMRAIDILSVLRTDWMHGELQHGSLAEEVENFMCAVEDALNHGWRFWREY